MREASLQNKSARGKVTTDDAAVLNHPVMWFHHRLKECHHDTACSVITKLSNLLLSSTTTQQKQFLQQGLGVLYQIKAYECFVNDTLLLSHHMAY